jgi:hypothetical protein
MIRLKVLCRITPGRHHFFRGKWRGGNRLPDGRLLPGGHHGLVCQWQNRSFNGHRDCRQFVPGMARWRAYDRNSDCKVEQQRQGNPAGYHM